MMSVIGIKRIFVLGILLALNVLMAGLIYFYAIPEQDKTERDIRALRGQSATVQSDIDRMQLEFEQLGMQQERFDKLKASGFFHLQDRSHAKDLMKSIQEQSRVISAITSIKSGYIEKDPEAEKSKHTLLVSAVEIQIKAFDDTDIYRYIDLAQTQFPGMLTLEKLDIRRIKDVNATILRAIAAGGNPELVEAQVSMLWTTMVPETAVQEGMKNEN